MNIPHLPHKSSLHAHLVRAISQCYLPFPYGAYVHGYTQYPFEEYSPKKLVHFTNFSIHIQALNVIGQ